MRYKEYPKVILSGMATVQVALLTAKGLLAGLGPVYFVCTCGGTAVSLAIMIRRVRLDVPESCGWWFKWGIVLVGSTMTMGFVGEYWCRMQETRARRERDGELLEQK